jgi:uncharacterized protein YqeY
MASAIETKLNDQLKTAMMAKDAKTSGVVRMLKTKIMERRTTKGFTGEITDEIALEVIAAYRKQMQKAVEEFEKLGEKGQEQATELKFEIQFCDQFLPKRLDEAALTSLIKERIAALQITDAKMANKLLGDIMKTHKGQVDAADIKRIAEAQLTK